MSTMAQNEISTVLFSCREQRSMQILQAATLMVQTGQEKEILDSGFLNEL